MLVGMIAAHETGHLLGNPDLYNNKGQNYITYKLSAKYGDLTKYPIKDYDVGYIVKPPNTTDNLMNNRMRSTVEYFQYTQILNSAKEELGYESGWECSVIPINQDCK